MNSDSGLFKQTEIGPIPADWEVINTDGFLSSEKCAIKIGPFGSQLKKEYLTAEGFKLYGQENIFEKDFRLGSRYVPKERFELLRTCELKPGDIIISMMGTIGFVTIVPEGIQTGLIDSHLLRLRINKNRFSAKFILYAFRSKLVQNQIDSLSVGTIMAGLSSRIIRMLIFPNPPLPEQQSIANILSSIDSKIDLNQEINKTLENIGQTIFKRWFVDFEFPNEEGKPYKSSIGEMVYNKELKQDIPRSWKVGCVEDVANVIGGGTPSTEVDDYFTNNGIPWLTPKDLSGYKGKFIEKGSLDITEKGLKNSSAKLMPKGTILFSSRAPIGYMAVALNDIATNQGFKSLIPKEGINSDYLYYFLRRITPYVQSISSGSTFAEVSGSTMKQIKIIIPEITVLKSYENFMSSINSKMIVNSKGIKTLTNVRDLLLPKLMSGKIRVHLDNTMERQ